MDYYWRFGSKDGKDHAYVFCRFVTTARDAVAAFQASYDTHLLMEEACQKKETQYWITRLQNENAELSSQLQAAKTGKVE